MGNLDERTKDQILYLVDQIVDAVPVGGLANWQRFRRALLFDLTEMAEGRLEQMVTARGWTPTPKKPV